MEAAGGQAPLTVGLGSGSGSGRLLGLLSDERLVARARAGSESAFAVLFERHYGKLLSFCRHMLGSQAEAEDAVQQAFANAYRDLRRGDKRIDFRPWLYRIARNQCVSMLRARRPQVELDADEPSLVGLSQEVAGRAELRDLLQDLTLLAPEQREALLLAELHDNSHAQVAEILGCDREKVKSLVFQARSSLMKSREARETPCTEIRRQLSVLTGGALRRSLIRRHLKLCPSCAGFAAEVRRQRQALAVVLPVVPSAALKVGAANAIAAAGTAGAAGAAGGAATAGPLAALAGKLGVSAAAIKGAATVVAVAAVATGGTAAVSKLEVPRGPSVAPPAASPLEREAPDANSPQLPPAVRQGEDQSPGERGHARSGRGRTGRSHSARGVYGRRERGAVPGVRGRPSTLTPGRRSRGARAHRRHPLAPEVRRPSRARPRRGAADRTKPVHTAPPAVPVPPQAAPSEDPAVDAGTTGPLS